MKSEKSLLTITLCIALSCFISADVSGQGVGINLTNADPDSSAGLDIDFTDRGLLMPRMTAVQRDGISGPANGLLVFVTTDTSFYYNEGTPAVPNWVPLLSSSSAGGWLLTGNSGTTTGTDFVGTSDAQDLDIRTNDTIHLRLTQKGQLEFLNTGNSVFIGELAGENDDLTANNNVFIGKDAARTLTTGRETIAIGTDAWENSNGSYGIAIGVRAGQNSTSSSAVLIGYDAGRSNSSTSNVMIGYEAGEFNTGNATTIVGYNAGVNLTGNSNTIIGAVAGGGTGTAANNTFVGHQSGAATTSGNSNTFIGKQAGMDNTTGYQNAALGAEALADNTTGFSNTGVGYRSLFTNLTGNNNTGLGMGALFSNTTGNSNTASGNLALFSNSSGFYNVAIGYQAVYNNTTAAYNTGIGYQALESNLTGSGNTSLGYRSLKSNTSTNNIAIGYSSGDNITTGSTNIIIGYDIDAPIATDSNQMSIGNLIFATGVDGIGTTISSGNVGIGVSAPGEKLDVAGHIWQTSTGSSVFVGEQAGAVDDLTNNGNVFLGFYSGFTNTNGDANVAVGYQALYSNNLGIGNIALGSRALSNITSSSNIGIGVLALGGTSTGGNNIAIGHNAGNNISTGSNNLIIGYSIDAPIATSSNQMSIGNLIFATGVDGTGTTLSTGNVGIGTTAPGAKLHVSSTGDPALFERTGSIHDNRLRITMTNQALSGVPNITANQTINFVASGAPGHTGDMAFSANADNTNTGDVQMILTNAGNVGIATTGPTSTLDINGSMSQSVTSVSATYTALATDHNILASAGSAFTITLPAASGVAGRIYHIKKIDAAANDVTIDANGTETIDGALTIALSSQYDNVKIICDGSNWHVLGANPVTAGGGGGDGNCYTCRGF